MRSSYSRAGMLVFLMFSATFAGCFGEDGGGELPDSDDLTFKVVGGSSNDSMAIPGGEWISASFQADVDMSVFIPYFIQDPGSLRAQNGTVLDLRSGARNYREILFPPRNDDVVFLIGEYGRKTGQFVLLMNLG